MDFPVFFSMVFSVFFFNRFLSVFFNGFFSVFPLVFPMVLFHSLYVKRYTFVNTPVFFHLFFQWFLQYFIRSTLKGTTSSTLLKSIKEREKNERLHAFIKWPTALTKNIVVEIRDVSCKHFLGRYMSARLHIHQWGNKGVRRTVDSILPFELYLHRQSGQPPPSPIHKK